MSNSMDNKFNSYEYHMIRKFTSMCYGRTCIIDRIKIHNKTSLWHEILTYLSSPDNGVLKIYKVECTPGKKNNSITDESQINYVVRHYFTNCLFISI